MVRTKCYVPGFVFLFAVVTQCLSQQLVTAPFKLANSPYDEQSPVLSPDGKALYFTVANHPQNTGGKKDPGDIWISLWIGGAWSVPENVIALNTSAYNGVAGFSADGSQLFLLGHYGKNGSPAASQGIAVSRRTDAGWSTPENISIPYFLNRSSEFSGMINTSGDIFIFSADSYGSKGVEDIYVSIKKDNQWTEPINLGPAINSELQEKTPSLSEDGKTLFFATNGRSGYGSFDIYSAERLDDSWTAWSTPINMRSPLNSSDRELYFRQAKGMSLFTTTRNSDGYGDIKALVDLLPPNRTDTVVKIIEVKHDLTAGKNKQVLISGKITNSKTNAPLSAKIIFKADSLYSATSSPDGRYQLIISATKVYNIEVQAPGFVNQSERLDIHTFELKTLEMNFGLQPIEVGARVNLKNILFYMGTTSLLEESYPELDVVVEFLKSNPKVEIELNGHTDNRGDAKKNLVLSQQRVERIKSYLVSKGITARRIKGKGFGGTRPIATNDSEEARRHNRRVEFLILKD